jgi:hypothetical protein
VIAAGLWFNTADKNISVVTKTTNHATTTDSQKNTVSSVVTHQNDTSTSISHSTKNNHSAANNEPVSGNNHGNSPSNEKTISKKSFSNQKHSTTDRHNRFDRQNSWIADGINQQAPGKKNEQNIPIDSKTENGSLTNNFPINNNSPIDNGNPLEKEDNPPAEHPNNPDDYVNTPFDNDSTSGQLLADENDPDALWTALEKWLAAHPDKESRIYSNPENQEPEWMIDAHYGISFPFYANFDYTKGSSYAVLALDGLNSGFGSPPTPQTWGYGYKYQTAELNISRRFGNRIWVESGLKLGIFKGLRKQDLVDYDYIPINIKAYSLGVPVSMRFLFVKKHKWNMYARTGILNVAGYRSSYDYYKYSYIGDWTLYNSPVETRFSYELSAHGNIGFERQITRNLTFDFRLEGRYYVPLSIGYQDMRNRWTIGVTTGLAWKF